MSALRNLDARESDSSQKCGSSSARAENTAKLGLILFLIAVKSKIVLCCHVCQTDLHLVPWLFLFACLFFNRLNWNGGSRLRKDPLQTVSATLCSSQSGFYRFCLFRSLHVWLMKQLSLWLCSPASALQARLTVWYFALPMIHWS